MQGGPTVAEATGREIVLTSRRILGEPWVRPRGGRGAVGGWQYAPGSSEAPNLEQGSEHDEISDHRGDGGVAFCIGRSGARRRLQRSNKNDASRLDRSVDHDPAHGRGVE